jgi:hypothetical protein
MPPAVSEIERGGEGGVTEDVGGVQFDIEKTLINAYSTEMVCHLYNASRRIRCCTSESQIYFDTTGVWLARLLGIFNQKVILVTSNTS